MTVAVHRVMYVSTGYPGGPGYTAFYFAVDSAGGATTDQQFLASFQTMYSLKALQPSAWTVNCDPQGQLLDPASGALVAFSSRPAGASAPIVGDGSDIGFGAGMSGACCSLGTNTINRSHKVKGRIFLVPMGTNAYDPDGTLKATIVNSVYTAFGSTLTAAVGWSVWSRPRAGVGGVLAPITSINVRDRAAYLSTRR